jgi:hypothetical protein
MHGLLTDIADLSPGGNQSVVYTTKRGSLESHLPRSLPQTQTQTRIATTPTTSIDTINHRRDGGAEKERNGGGAQVEELESDDEPNAYERPPGGRKTRGRETLNGEPGIPDL